VLHTVLAGPCGAVEVLCGGGLADWLDWTGGGVVLCSLCQEGGMHRVLSVSVLRPSPLLSPLSSLLSPLSSLSSVVSAGGLVCQSVNLASPVQSSGGPS
jgi:hypothetical protein